MGFKIAARAVLQLGAELISSDSVAFYELIKNAFDAQSTSGVRVRVDDELKEKECFDIEELERRVDEAQLALAGFNKFQSAEGSNPFDNLAFTVEGDKLRFKEYMQSGWEFARDVGFMPLSDVSYNLGGKTNHTFSTLFPIYDWQANDGYKNLGTWIETAARQGGR